MENVLKRQLVIVTGPSNSITNITTTVSNTIITLKDSGIINSQLQTTTIPASTQPVPNNMSSASVLLGETV